jgi:hypothetical protein
MLQAQESKAANVLLAALVSAIVEGCHLTDGHTEDPPALLDCFVAMLPAMTVRALFPRYRI